MCRFVAVGGFVEGSFDDVRKHNLLWGLLGGQGLWGSRRMDIVLRKMQV